MLIVYGNDNINLFRGVHDACSDAVITPIGFIHVVLSSMSLSADDACVELVFWLVFGLSS